MFGGWPGEIANKEKMDNHKSLGNWQRGESAGF